MTVVFMTITAPNFLPFSFCLYGNKLVPFPLSRREKSPV